VSFFVIPFILNGHFRVKYDMNTEGSDMKYDRFMPFGVMKVVTALQCVKEKTE